MDCNDEGKRREARGERRRRGEKEGGEPVQQDSTGSHHSKKYKKTGNTRNPDLGQISSFGCFQYVYQIWFSGLNLNRFCVPNRIIEMSNSSMF